MYRKRGQSTLEYVIILSAIVLAIFAGRTIIRNTVSNTMNQTANAMNQAANRLPNISN